MSTRGKEAAPKISLCMNVRDEEKDLRRSLESSRSAADEIIIVDTGSRDGSMDVAREFGARVFEHPWQDDMSEARNHALDQARGEWILWLDPDEVLLEGGAEKIRAAITDPQRAGFYLSFTNLLDGNRQDHFLLPRLFRNHPEVHWINAIHSQIVGPLTALAKNEDLTIGVCDARVLHYGYLKQNVADKKKMERMRRGFQKQLQQHPRDPYSWYKFGDFQRQEDRQAALDALHRSRELIHALAPPSRSEISYGAEVYALIAHLQHEQGENEAALATLEAAPPEGFPLTPNYYFIKACVNREKGNLGQALADFQQCLDFDGVSLPVQVQDGVTGARSFFGMAECYRKQKRPDAMEDCFRKALARDAHFFPAVFKLAEHFLATNRIVPAIETLLGYLRGTPEPDPQWERLGLPLLQKALLSVSEDLRKEIYGKVKP